MDIRRSKNARSSLRPSLNRHKQHRRQFEMLEHRELLHAGGISALLTVSYAPDGTDVSGQESSLHSTFSSLGTDGQWQSVITNAFHEWSKHTNADIGVVADSGHPFGSIEQAGASFGDIRIAAAPLAESVFAISLPTDNLALGSWASDIVFNSRIDWTSIDQLASVALHEAGHIFGLSHSDDPTSAMHTHGASEITSPSAADVASIQFLYGERNLDNNEVTTPNDSLEDASPLSVNLAQEMLRLSFGDISSYDDIDFYQIETEDDIEGAVRIVVDGRGISNAKFSVNLYDEDGDLLEESGESEAGIAQLDYEFDEEAEFFVSVELDEVSVADNGRYMIAVSIDPQELEDEEDNEEYDELEEDELRFAEGELDDYLLAGGDFLFNEDFEEDDDLENAKAIVPRSFNAGRTWFEQVGSISGADVDVYQLQSPEDEDGLQNVMTVRVQAITDLALAPSVTVRDESGEEIEAGIIRSGNGEHIVQFTGVEPDSDYFVQVEAEDPNGPESRGNYQLSVNFGSESVELTTFAKGSLSSEQPLEVRQLFVATPQLFHFLFAVDHSENTASVKMELFDQSGTLQHSLEVAPGQTRSSNNPLLQPGEYTVRVSLVSNPKTDTELTFHLTGFAVSNPLGVIPVDPTAEPIYKCDGVSNQFCYPGGTTSDSPFFWDDYISNYIREKQKEQFSPVGIWDWLWEDVNATSQPAPDAGADVYRVYDQVLIVSQADGLLNNDRNAGDAPMIVRLAELPQNGALNLSPDGNFRYTPNPGFWGMEVFTYEVYGFDSSRWSSPTTVELSIDRGGDTNSDGEVDFSDFLQFSRNFGSMESSWISGDFDGNGKTDFTDFLIMTANFGKSSAIAVPPISASQSNKEN